MTALTELGAAHVPSDPGCGRGALWQGTSGGGWNSRELYSPGRRRHARSRPWGGGGTLREGGKAAPGIGADGLADVASLNIGRSGFTRDNQGMRTSSLIAARYGDNESLAGRLLAPDAPSIDEVESRNASRKTLPEENPSATRPRHLEVRSDSSMGVGEGRDLRRTHREVLTTYLLRAICRVFYGKASRGKKARDDSRPVLPDEDPRIRSARALANHVVDRSLRG